MTLPEDINVGLVWIAILGLLIVYKIIDILATKGMEKWDHRQGNGLQGSIKKLATSVDELQRNQMKLPPYPQCHYAPDHFKHVEETHSKVIEIHAMQLAQKDQINQGVFACKVRGPHLRTLERIEDKLNEGKAIG